MTGAETARATEHRWIRAAIPRYTLALAGVTIAGAMIVTLATPSRQVATGIMVAAVALIGLPHGAYDGVIGRRLSRPRFGHGWWAVFGGLYLASAALGVLFWIITPWLALSTLLVLGALHWGLDDLETAPRSIWVRSWFAVSRGSIPIAVPMVAHPSEIAEIFGALTLSSITGSAITPVGAVILGVALPGVAAQLMRAYRDDKQRAVRGALEIAALTAWFVATDPLLGFTLYFCMWHAARHSLRSASELDPARFGVAMSRYLRGIIGVTLLTWVLVAAVWFVLLDTADPERTWWRVIFIGLFALTLPHVALEWIESRVTADEESVSSESAS